MVVMETAKPIKFVEAMREALGDDIVIPGYAEEMQRMSNLPQKYLRMDLDIDAVKAVIAKHALRAA